MSLIDTSRHNLIAVMIVMPAPPSRTPANYWPAIKCVFLHYSLVAHADGVGGIWYLIAAQQTNDKPALLSYISICKFCVSGQQARIACQHMLHPQQCSLPLQCVCVCVNCLLRRVERLTQTTAIRPTPQTWFGLWTKSSQQGKGKAGYLV